MAGRPEGPVDPEAGPVQRLAYDLRALRAAAGSPTYRAMAVRSGLGASTLSHAAAGGQLPTLPVVLAYVRACGGDEAEWERHWRRAAEEAPAAPRPDDDVTSAPYRGLARFEAGDRELFFGRDRLIADLLRLVRGHRISAVVGASGCGKSSLLRAGLVPCLREPDGNGRLPAAVRILTPGPRPAATHRAALTAAPADGDTVLVVDQFEELFTLTVEPDQRHEFLEMLLTAAEPGSRLRVVIAVRADFLDRCAEHHRLAGELRNTTLLVGPMSPDELREAIVRPATAAGLTVERALTTQIVDDVGAEPGGLPLMSHALLETWRRRQGRMLTRVAYDAAGGVHGALARTAEELYSRLRPEQARTARRIMLRLITPGAGTQDTSRPVDRAELAPGGAGDAAIVVEQLARARLITLEGDTVTLAHEALITAWFRLRAWIDAERDRLRLHRQLTRDAGAWLTLGRDPGALYRGTRLGMAEEAFPDDRRGDLTPLEAEFLCASLEVRDRERRAASRTAQRFRALLAALSVLLLLASTAAVVAFQQRSLARSDRDRAVAEQVVAEARQVSVTDPSLAAQLYLTAYRLRSSPDAAAGLLNTQNLPLSTVLSGHIQAVYAVAFSPNGRLLATGAGDNTIRLWSLANPTRPVPVGKPLTGHSSWVYWLQFSPDGHTLASASRDRTARLWDVRDPAHPRALGRPLTGHSDYVFSVSFSGDGRTLATASHDRTVRLWNVSDPAHARALGRPLTGATDSVASAAFSPDGRTVAAPGHDHMIRLWNVTDRERPKLWRQPLTGSDVVYAVAFRRDSRVMASVGNDRTVRLWDVSDPAHARALGRPLTGHTDTLLAVAFSPDGRTLATGGADHTIRLWDVSDPLHPAPLGQPLIGHRGFVNWMAFSPDGRSLASASDDHTVRLWHLPGTVLTGHTGAVSSVAFSPNSHTLASAGDDRTVRLWDVHAPTHPRQVSEVSTGRSATRSVFRPDGRLLASTDGDSTVRLWDVSDPARPRPVGTARTGSTDPAHVLAFTPDGRVLITDGPDHSLLLWDVTHPAHPTILGRPLTGHISVVHWAEASPDGHTLASTSEDDRVRLWDIRDPARPRALPNIRTGDTGGTLWGAFDPGGRLLATAGVGHDVRLWNVSDPAHATALGRPLTGHTSAVTWAGFSPDGRTLAAAGEDRTVLLWNVADPAHPVPWGEGLTATHTDAIETAAYSPDGRLLVTAGPGRAIELTPVGVDQAIRRICASTGALLTSAQWRQYVPDLPYAPPCRGQ
ncbi:nSTAND1 domain-containing NTPase [Streptomyces sp. NBC_01483]|uniref:nSTAND1 domain-containing NTPase n=1 Tax=Streptomyces sp. NBC_01483 TaxID=2903883 RepID=UPI002E37A7F9|nr:WD40 repeat domain-containing protein [Streptomyces sp. NBC_01483]